MSAPAVAVNAALSPEALGLDGPYLEAYPSVVELIAATPGGDGVAMLKGARANYDKVITHAFGVIGQSENALTEAGRQADVRAVLLECMVAVSESIQAPNEPARPKAQRLPNPPNRLATEVREEHIRQFEELRRATLKSYSSDRDLTPKERLGRVVALMIVFGGVVSQKLLAAAVRQWRDPLRVTGPWVHQDLTLYDSQGFPTGLRRVFFHPTCALLLLSDKREIDASKMLAEIPLVDRHGKIATSVDRSLKSFLVAAGLEVSCGNAKDLMRLTRTALRAYLPEVLVRYLSGELASESLSTAVFARIHGCAVPVVTEAEDRSDETPDTPMDVGPVPASVPWERAFQKIWLALRASSPSDAVTILNESLDELEAQKAPPAATLIGKCFLHLLTEGLRSGHPPQLSTLRLMNGQISWRWVMAVGPRDPGSLTADELSETYINVLEDLPSGDSRRRVSSHLRELDNFLRSAHHIPAYPKARIPGAGGYGSVSPNLLMPSELEELCAFLRSSRAGFASTTEREAAAFLTRLCWAIGLRRNEALHLRCGDVWPGERPLLNVIGYEVRRLKTIASERRVPLLLAGVPFSEWTVALAGCENGERRREVSEQLIAPMFQGHEVIFDHRVLPRINNAMKVVTGDPSIHFHHTRHSAATLCFLALMLLAFDHVRTADESFAKELRRLMEGSEMLRHADANRHQLSELLQGCRHASAKSGDAVAALLGHASSETSYEHYIHCLDMVSCLFMQAIPADGLYSAGRACASVDRTFARHWQADNGLSALIHVGTAAPDLLQVASPAASAPGDAPASLSDQDFSQLEAIAAECRRQAEKSGGAAETLEQLFKCLGSLAAIGAGQALLPRIKGAAVFPTLETADSLRIARRLLEILQHARAVNPGGARWLLDYWSANAYSSKARIAFREGSAELKRFVDTLIAGGLRRDEYKEFVRVGNQWRIVRRRSQPDPADRRRVVIQLCPLGMRARPSAVTWAFAMEWVMDQLGRPVELLPEPQPAKAL